MSAKKGRVENILGGNSVEVRWADITAGVDQGGPFPFDLAVLGDVYRGDLNDPIVLARGQACRLKIDDRVPAHADAPPESWFDRSLSRSHSSRGETA